MTGPLDERALVGDGWIAPRARFATPERFPEAEHVIAAWPQKAFAQLGPIDRSTAIAILTHDPKIDDAALEVALRSDAGYVGAMGSRRMQATRRQRPPLLIRAIVAAMYTTAASADSE